MPDDIIPMTEIGHSLGHEGGELAERADWFR
jgi:hypothetical protein